jgi:uncharacterized membrane protein
MSENNIALQNRAKSPVFWSALMAQVLALLVFTGVIDLNVSDTIQNIICGLLELLVAFGILNNPTNGDGF